MDLKITNTIISKCGPNIESTPFIKATKKCRKYSTQVLSSRRMDRQSQAVTLLDFAFGETQKNANNSF